MRIVEVRCDARAAYTQHVVIDVQLHDTRDVHRTLILCGERRRCEYQQEKGKKSAHAGKSGSCQAQQQRPQSTIMSSDHSTIGERFARAVHNSDVDELRALLPHRDALRDVIDAPSFSFDSPALVACAGRGKPALIDALLALGADPNRKSNWWAGGFHALYSASAEVAKRLLDAGAVPDACAAAHLDRLDLLRDIIARDPSRVHERGGDGQMPLHFARSRVVADFLLASGADIDARDLDHRGTAAEWMLGDASDPIRSRIDLARYLVERGAHCDIFLAAALGETSRALVLVEHNPDVLTLRTGQGAYAEVPPSSYHIYLWTIGANLTPLQTAARFGHHATIAALEPYADDAQRLLLACHLGDREKARAIMRNNPDIVATLGPDDRRALTNEAWTANAKAVTLMLELGFDPSEEANGGTALHCAAWEGCAECVEALLRYDSGRALLAVRDPHFGGTPLDWCRHGAANCSRKGADHAAVERLLVAAAAP